MYDDDTSHTLCLCAETNCPYIRNSTRKRSNNGSEKYPFRTPYLVGFCDADRTFATCMIIPAQLGLSAHNDESLTTGQSLG